MLYKGAKDAAMMADSDDIRLMINTNNQLSRIAAPSGGDKARNPPNAVATPLPPLNWKKTGYKWPKNTANAVAVTHARSNPARLTIVTGSTPLTTSISSTVAANFFPPMRSTFVAPGFPEPSDLGSGRPANLHKIIALDNEPIK